MSGLPPNPFGQRGPSFAGGASIPIDLGIQMVEAQLDALERSLNVRAAKMMSPTGAGGGGAVSRFGGAIGGFFGGAGGSRIMRAAGPAAAVALVAQGVKTTAEILAANDRRQVFEALKGIPLAGGVLRTGEAAGDAILGISRRRRFIETGREQNDIDRTIRRATIDAELRTQANRVSTDPLRRRAFGAIGQIQEAAREREDLLRARDERIREIETRKRLGSGDREPLPAAPTVASINRLFEARVEEIGSAILRPLLQGVTTGIDTAIGGFQIAQQAGTQQDLLRELIMLGREQNLLSTNVLQRLEQMLKGG
jgi:hypothetical protein